MMRTMAWRWTSLSFDGWPGDLLELSGADWTPAGLWLAVVVSGLYHG